MIKFMKRTAAVLLFNLFAFASYAQQDPLYSQYLNNPVLLNPAYTGLNNRLNVVAGYRLQWAGFDGSPSTLNFSAHTSLVQNKVGAGIIVVQDKIGDTKITEASTAYAYKIVLNDDRVLSFGLQAGIINYRNDAANLNPKDAGDPLFGFVNETKFNIGTGIALKSERFILGISVPRVMPTTVNPSGTKEIEVYNRTLYLMGAYVMYLTESIRLKSSVLLRATANAPLSADINFNLNVEENYTLGLFTRNFNALGFLAQMNIKDYRIGYVFEVPTNASVGTRFTTHEVSIGMSLAAFGFQSREKSNF
jgi:type IX secretion system PorP/SprF family membrane protein